MKHVAGHVNAPTKMAYEDEPEYEPEYEPVHDHEAEHDDEEPMPVDVGPRLVER
jgi:hypothetical protein